MTVDELMAKLSDLPRHIEVRIQTEDEDAHKVGDVVLCAGGDYIPYEGEDGDLPVVFIGSDWLSHDG